jgi:hypothetical protein
MFAILLMEDMNPFYQNIASFPTAFFTFLLVITTLYWLVAVLGFIDIDFLDFDIPDADGKLDVNMDSGLSNPDVLAGLMLRFGLVGVPVTIIVSLISLFGWLVSYYVVHFFFGVVPDGVFRWLVGVPVLIGSLYLAAMITAVLIKPLRPLFQKAQQETIKHVLGQSAVVRTSRVDNGFGEAVLEDGGAGLILKVRSAGEEVFEKGDKVVLLEFVKEENIYRVISEAEFKGS